MREKIIKLNQYLVKDKKEHIISGGINTMKCRFADINYDISNIYTSVEKRCREYVVPDAAISDEKIVITKEDIDKGFIIYKNICQYRETDFGSAELKLKIHMLEKNLKRFRRGLIVYLCMIVIKRNW